jgi:hypothetical protein
LEEVGREYTRHDGTTGRLGPQTTQRLPSRRGREFLTEAMLARHFAGSRRGDIVGLHTTSTDNKSRWGAFEVHWHGPTSPAPAVNLAAALAWYGLLRQLGFLPLLTGSNGQGGYHLLVLFGEPVPPAKVTAAGITARNE